MGKEKEDEPGDAGEIYEAGTDNNIIMHKPQNEDGFTTNGISKRLPI